MTEREQMVREEIIQKFLAMIEDETGTVRRYAETLKNKPLWQRSGCPNGN